jgi:phenylalanyl-tRNA synthetase beta chain
MNLVYSWLNDYVDIDLSLEKLASLLTMLGLEVEEIQLVGLSKPPAEKHEFKYSGLSWDPEKIVVGQVNEVMPHPNAERLVLCRLFDGLVENIVLTGAPNLYPYKGQGPLPKPIKVAYAREGAELYDGHQPGQVLTRLKRAKIRGVESYSMACSEKELGISEEHEGIIFLPEDAPTGMPLVDYMGDAVFEIKILPNMIRNACVVGVAREIAAATGKTLRLPREELSVKGPSVEGKAFIQITDPQLNPRFVLGLVQGTTPCPSPYQVQRRLRLAGMRPINSIVDATNYVMLEIGEPLHAFDYDELVRRAGGGTPTIITRAAQAGETLVTLDNISRNLDPNTILVTDTAGALSLAGVMGGLESEVTEKTRNVLLEGATWNFINIRKTTSAQKLISEAAYRFSRGIHPALALEAVQLGLDRIALWSGGQIAAGVVDVYAQPYEDPTVHITEADVKRHLGIRLPAPEIAALLARLEFKCVVEGDGVYAKSPAHRLDIGEELIGVADMMEELARMVGYDNIPASRLSDSLPVQNSNLPLEREIHIQDVLVSLGMQEVITYRMTSPEREARLLPRNSQSEELPYVRLANPIAAERVVMRRSLLASMLETIEHNIRLRPRLAFFEIGPIFLPLDGDQLPEESWQLVMGMTGLRSLPAWDLPAPDNMDFFDLKGLLEKMLSALQIEGIHYEPANHPSFHPGKCARVYSAKTDLGILGELHPQVRENYDFGKAPVLAAELDLQSLLNAIPQFFEVQSVPVFPPVLEDLAVIVDEAVPAERVVDAIYRGGGKIVTDVTLFDMYRGAQLGPGKKSLAYSLTYQAADRTLDDKEAGKIRKHIIFLLENELGAKIRSE